MAKNTTSPNGLDGVVGHEHGMSTNYITKKGLPANMAENQGISDMPPGMDLNNQECADIRPFRELIPVSFNAYRVKK